MRIESQEIEQLPEENTDICVTSADFSPRESRPSVRLIVVAIAAVSALTGGLAAAWYYRKTLSRLQQAEIEDPDSKFGIRNAADDEDL